MRFIRAYCLSSLSARYSSRCPKLLGLGLCFVPSILDYIIENRSAKHYKSLIQSKEQTFATKLTILAIISHRFIILHLQLSTIALEVCIFNTFFIYFILIITWR